MQLIKVATLSEKGQVTIPIKIRKLIGVENGQSVAFYLDGKDVVLMNINNLNIEIKNPNKITIIKGERR